MKNSVILHRILVLSIITLVSYALRAQDVTILSPTGSEEVKFNTTLDISWSNSGLGANDQFLLQYNIDGGTFTNIVSIFHSQLTNNGDESSYTWTLPDLSSNLDNQIKIRVLNSTNSVSDTSNAFRLYFEPSVGITSPTGTEELKFNTTLDITWDNADLGANDQFLLQYRVDGGSFTNIVSRFHSQLTNDGSQSLYTWSLPDFSSALDNQIEVRVLNSTRNVSDTSNAFRLYFEPSVGITSPTGVEELKFNTTLDITWDNADLGANDQFLLQYRVDGGSFTNIVSRFHSQLTNDGSQSLYTWSLPDFSSALDNQIEVRVLNSTRNVSDTSNAFRLYFEPSVGITSPTGVEELKFNTTLDITWDNADLGANDQFLLQYRVDGGSFTNIVSRFHSQLTNDGSQSLYTWSLPDFSSALDNQVEVRVLNSTRNVSDTSNAFRLYFEPSVTISSPANGEFVALSAQKTITWINADLGANDQFLLQYSIDGGSFINIVSRFHSQLTNVDDESSYIWPVPATATTDIKVKVINSTRGVEAVTKSFVLCDVCPGVSIYAPNGGEIFAVGETTEIGWSLGSTWDPADNVVIDFSSDGGTTYEMPEIYNGTYDAISNNTFPLAVPNVITSQGMIRITNTTTTDTDTSDGTFEIQPNILEAPTDLFILEDANGSLTLSWLDNEANETGYRVEFSDDNTNWSQYGSNLPADTQLDNTAALSLETAFWWRVVAFNDVASAASTSKYAGRISAPGTALSLDGVDDYVSIPDSDDWTIGSNDFTFEFWFKANDLTGTPTLVTQSVGGASSASSFYIGLNYNGVGSISLYTTTGTTWTDELHSDAGVVSAGKWYHVAFTRTSIESKIYLDGVETTSTGTVAATVADGTRPIEFGVQDGALYLNGEVDEFGFWKVARTATEIADNWLLTRNGNETGLTAYYRFDQTNDSAILPDRTINALDGTLNTGSSSAQWVTSEALTETVVTLEVQTPNGGESLMVSEEYEITWTTENIELTDLIEIRLSTDGGTSYSILNDGTFATYNGSFLWTVPDQITDMARIQIANTTTGLTDESNADFNIIPFNSNTALSFSGGNKYVQIPDASVFDIDTDFTIETWVKTTATGQQGLVTQGLSSDGYAFFALSGNIYFQYFSSGAYQNGANALAVNVPGLLDGDWHHVAVVVNGGTGQLFADGTLMQTISTMLEVDESTSDIHLGYSSNVGALNGSMDEVRFWDYALSDAEIFANYAAELSGTEAGLKALYKFSEGSGTLAGNAVANENHGTLVNHDESADWVSGPVLEAAVTVPAITVTSPNGGETWDVGTEQIVSWTYAGFENTDLIEIRLSTDGGENYTIVNDGTFATYPDNTFNWTVPSNPTTQGRIQVVNTTNQVKDSSDFDFTINQPIVPTITLLQPGGGEFWEIGTQQTIQWTDEGFDGTDNIEIRISRDGGANYDIISQGILDSTYPSKQISWTVEAPASTTVFIQVANTTKNVEATSFEALEIGTITRTITVTSPNGGETWMLESPATITWESEGMDPTDNLQIQISTDNGDTFPFTPVNTTFSQFPQNTFTWSSVATSLGLTDNAIVRITNTTRGISDQSDGPFTIAPAADVTAPSFNSQPIVEVGVTGKNAVDITVNLNEISTVYYVALEDGFSSPNATQIKEITEENPLDGQVIAGSFEYAEANQAQSIATTGEFIVGSLYDFYFTAEDADGNLNPGFSRPNTVAQLFLTPLEKDSAALRTMYDEMGGENWTDIQNDWTDEANAISSWSEVTIANDRVTEINLSGKGLKGAMSNEIAEQLDQLTSFDIGDNDITDIPDFSGTSSLTSLVVTNNRLSFDPIIRNLDVDGFSYDPQKKIGEINYDRIPAGTNKTLTAPFLGSGVNYEWRFGPLIPGQGFNNVIEEIPNDAGKVQSYTIQNITAAEQGTYRFRATHEDSRLVAGFELEGRNQNIVGITDLFGTIRSDGTPISGGDVFIYRQTPEGPFAKEDSTEVSSNGGYSLIGVALGNFIVQIKPNRDNNPTAIQTYYISAETYLEADTLFLDSRQDNIDIDLRFFVPAPMPETGATISGSLESDFEDLPEEEGSRITSRRKVRKAGCSMRRFKSQGRLGQDDVETEIAYYIETDDEGFFSFVGVEPGRYLINIEFPGVPMDNKSDIEFFIDPDKENQVFDVEALITEDGITVAAQEILFNWKPYLKEVVMYPNPTEGILGIDYLVYRNIKDLQIKIINAEGRTMIEQEVMHLNGRHHTSVDMTRLASGVYFMVFTDRAGTFIEQFKVGKK
ncbi:MAG: T9SS type A sorting domain-containing protein [Cyclobacteriaceae bacterium]